MRVVETAEFQPAVCACTNRGDGPFVDFESTLNYIDPHVYLKTDIVQAAARLLGMVNGEDYAKALEELEDARQAAEALREELADVREKLDAIDVIESADFRARKKRGPKKVAA